MQIFAYILWFSLKHDVSLSPISSVMSDEMQSTKSRRTCRNYLKAGEQNLRRNKKVLSKLHDYKTTRHY